MSLRRNSITSPHRNPHQALTRMNAFSRSGRIASASLAMSSTSTIAAVTIPKHGAVWLGLEAAGRENGGDEIATERFGGSATGRSAVAYPDAWACHSPVLKMAELLAGWLKRCVDCQRVRGSPAKDGARRQFITAKGRELMSSVDVSGQ